MTWPRSFVLIHVYDVATGHCVLTIPRPGITPDGKEVPAHLRQLARRIRRHWPDTRITVRLTPSGTLVRFATRSAVRRHQHQLRNPGVAL
jgi:hypothetical protein